MALNFMYIKTTSYSDHVDERPSTFDKGKTRNTQFLARKRKYDILPPPAAPSNQCPLSTPTNTPKPQQSPFNRQLCQEKAPGKCHGEENKREEEEHT